MPLQFSGNPLCHLLQIKTRVFHGAGFTLTPFGKGWQKGLKFNFDAKNLTDNKTEDYLGYPIPGRTFFGTLEYKYGKKEESKK